MSETELKPCPCGKVPTELVIEEGDTFRWRRITGNCCDEWEIETRVTTIQKDGEDLAERQHRDCVEAWNVATRADQPRPEPVAWLLSHGSHTEASVRPLIERDIEMGWTQEPLYTDQPRPAVPEGLPVAQEPKYTTDGKNIINRASGEAIPHDEPVFIFRAQDSRAIRALDAYIGQLPEGVHRKAVIGRLRDFHLFSRTQADRMKEPDTVPLSTAQQPEGGEEQ